MNLREYLDAEGYRRAWFAEQIGVSVYTLAGYISGRQKPSIDVAIRILKLTKGKVTLEALADPFRTLYVSGKVG